MSYQPKTGAKCSCRRGIWRDNCPNCEGTGWAIDFRAIRQATPQDVIRDSLSKGEFTKARQSCTYYGLDYETQRAEWEKR